MPGRKGESEREEERGVALRLVHARTPTSGTHVTRPDRYALPKPRSLSLSLSSLYTLPRFLFFPCCARSPLFSSLSSFSSPFFAFSAFFPLPSSRVTDREYTDDNRLPVSNTAVLTSDARDARETRKRIGSRRRSWIQEIY